MIAKKLAYKYRSKLIKDREDFKGFYHLFDNWWRTAARFGRWRRDLGAVPKKNVIFLVLTVLARTFAVLKMSSSWQITRQPKKM
jgi:hypothetical protein